MKVLFAPLPVLVRLVFVMFRRHEKAFVVRVSSHCQERSEKLYCVRVHARPPARTPARPPHLAVCRS